MGLGARRHAQGMPRHDAAAQAAPGGSESGTGGGLSAAPGPRSFSRSYGVVGSG
jgi:hypothetical protein